MNFDNPRVLEAVLDVMAYWLDMGVDGLRLDAIPYLIEREGTNCENLPESHAVIKRIRAAVDARYPDRMLLAEANLWPEETAQYFGQGDECHQALPARDPGPGLWFQRRQCRSAAREAIEPFDVDAADHRGAAFACVIRARLAALPSSIEAAAVAVA